MKKKAAAILTSVLICLFGVQGAFPWGSLTHAYITDQIVAVDGAIRDNAIYGSTAPDFANYMFGSPYQQYLMDRTHTDFLRVWKMAEGGPIHIEERALAFGFVAHNIEDYTAHSMSQTLNPEEGYVVQKAVILEAMLDQLGVWQTLNYDDPAYAPMRAELSHELIEFAGDLFLALYLDPQAGEELASAAAGCSLDFPALLTRAYAGNLVANSNQMGIRLNQPGASNILKGGELMFRGGMIGYGSLFSSQEPEIIVTQLAIYLKDMAALQGIEIPNSDLVAQVLSGALFVIQDDFAPEVFGTISFTAEGLAQQKVAY